MDERNHLSRRALALRFLVAPALGWAVPARAETAFSVKVTKDPTCGCCDGWISHIRSAGFEVNVSVGAVNPLKARFGIPRDLASCHTAEVGGYVIEGHVPAEAIRRLLAERPAATGLAVPGMPVGSPGMEVEGMKPEIYEVILFGPAERKAFARYRGGELDAVKD